MLNNETLEALEEATVDNADEESQIYIHRLDSNVDKWIMEKRTFHIKHALFNKNQRRLKVLEACPKEDYIPVLIDRACVCKNCNLIQKCDTGETYDEYLNKNLDKIEFKGAWVSV